MWKIVGTSFQCIIVPQSQGEGPKKEYNLMRPGPQSVTHPDVITPGCQHKYILSFLINTGEMIIKI